MKKIAVLGSTGSIGTQTLEVVRAQKDIEVTALAAGSNIVRLEEQIREFHPEIVCVWEEEKAKALALTVSDLPVKVVCGMEGLIAAAVETDAEIVVTAIVGMIGIRPTIAAMEAGKDIALANKETLVTAGHIIMPLAKEKGVKILPVDSEHSAIFQSLNGEDKKAVHKILLTASGGPFRGKTREELKKVRIEDALKHPNWSMGRKITIDSSTMVNKGLEVMEAHWLFDVSMDQVQVVVQPQSVIHSMVQFDDGAVIAQLGTPDMKLPIQYALYYPERRFLAGDRPPALQPPSIVRSYRIDSHINYLLSILYCPFYSPFRRHSAIPYNLSTFSINYTTYPPVPLISVNKLFHLPMPQYLTQPHIAYYVDGLIIFCSRDIVSPAIKKL